MSVKYVSGEIREIICPHDGSSPSGMKIPLMKIKGNFTMTVSNITVLGLLVGTEDNIIPNAEKQKAARIIPNPKRAGY